jgi:hypothetical protein
LDSILQKAKTAGVDVTVAPDGAVTFKTSREATGENQGNELDEWIAKHADQTQRH